MLVFIEGYSVSYHSASAVLFESSCSSLASIRRGDWCASTPTPRMVTAMTELASFFLFSELPLELQRSIWIDAWKEIEQRIIQLVFDSNVLQCEQFEHVILDILHGLTYELNNDSITRSRKLRTDSSGIATRWLRAVLKSLLHRGCNHHEEKAGSPGLPDN